MMTTDVTTITGITRPSSASNNVNRPANNVVPINVNAAPPVNVEPRESSLEDIKQAADQVNDFVQKINRNLEFSVDESSGRVVITVREAETGKIIRQIPPEELLSIADLVRENNGNVTTSPGILIADKG